jgi:hypothetical protein
MKHEFPDKCRVRHQDIALVGPGSAYLDLSTACSAVPLGNSVAVAGVASADVGEIFTSRCYIDKTSS